MCDFRHFWHDKLCNFCHLRAYYMNWIQDSVANHFKAITALYLYSPCTLWNIKYFTSSFAENLKPFFLHSGKSTLQFPQCGKFKLYFPHCGIHHKVLSIMWKLLLLLPQNSFNYLTVEVLLAYIVYGIFYSTYFAHCGT